MIGPAARSIPNLTKDVTTTVAETVATVASRTCPDQSDP
jgi:hypothetical protein